MWMHPLVDPAAGDRVLDDLVDAALGQRLVLAEAAAPCGEEDRIGAALLGPSFNQSLQPPDQVRRQRDIADSIALAVDPQVRLSTTSDEVARSEAGELLEPEPTVGEDL